MDIAKDREQRGKPGEEFPVAGTEGAPDEAPDRAESGSLDHGALDETLPADRAGWEADETVGGSAGTAGESPRRST